MIVGENKLSLGREKEIREEESRLIQGRVV
jgi:hypothetical protein